MLIFYVDESGSHGMNADPNNPSRLAKGNSEWFVLAAVGVHDTSRRPLAEALFDLRKTHFGELADNWEEAEIKGRYVAMARQRIVEGSGHPEKSGYSLIRSLDSLNSFESDLAAILARFRPTIFMAAIDKQGLLDQKQNPTALGSGYAFLYRRVAILLDKVSQGEGGVFVADQQESHEGYFDSGEMLAFRALMDKRGTRDAYYNTILDKPLWIDTKLSSWDREIIQLADLAAFELHQRVAGNPGSDILWSEIYRCLAVEASTRDPAGEGIVIYPMPPGWPNLTP